MQKVSGLKEYCDRCLRAEFTDIPLCFEVEASQEDSTLSERDFRNSIIDSNVIFLVAEQNQQVAGFILGFIVPTRRREAIIHSTMVHKQYTQKGIGSSLVRNFAELAFKQGVEQIYAEVEEGSYKFYEKCGFKKTGVWYSMLLKKDELLKEWNNTSMGQHNFIIQNLRLHKTVASSIERYFLSASILALQPIGKI